MKLSMNQFCLQKLIELPAELYADDPLYRATPTEAEQELIAFLDEEAERVRKMAELKAESLKSYALATGNKQTIPVKGWTNKV